MPNKVRYERSTNCVGGIPQQSLASVCRLSMKRSTNCVGGIALAQFRHRLYQHLLNRSPALRLQPSDDCYPEPFIDLKKLITNSSTFIFQQLATGAPGYTVRLAKCLGDLWHTLI